MAKKNKTDADLDPSPGGEPTEGAAGELTPALPAAAGESPPGAVAPAAGRARLCSENDRAAGTGMRRFKLRAVDADRPLPRYVLAPDRTSAAACYHAAEGFDELPDESRPKLSVTELPD